MKIIDIITLWTGRAVWAFVLGWLLARVARVHLKSLKGFCIFLLNLRDSPAPETSQIQKIPCFIKTAWEIYMDEWEAELNGFTIEYNRIKP